jgi:hypothetical protein
VQNEEAAALKRALKRKRAGQERQLETEQRQKQRLDELRSQQAQVQDRTEEMRIASRTGRTTGCAPRVVSKGSLSFVLETMPKEVALFFTCCPQIPGHRAALVCSWAMTDRLNELRLCLICCQAPVRSSRKTRRV